MTLAAGLATFIHLATAAAPPRDSVVAFTGANVVSLRGSGVSANQNVVVRNGIIVAVGPASATPVPAGARRIDARGKYLLAGLADYHVHIAERGDLALYLRGGVTTLVHMGGFGAAVLAWRDSIRAGSLVGPDLWVGAFINGPRGAGGPATAQTVEEAREQVRWAAAQRYDFIKVYNSLTEPQFLAIMEEAGQLGLPVLGHAVRSVGLERALGMGQRAVAHAEEFLYSEIRSLADTVRLPEVVVFTRRSGAALIANLSAFEAITRQWGTPAVLDSFFRMPEARSLSPYWQSRWRGADYVTRRGSLTRLPFLKTLTLAMQRGGVTVLPGTDSPSIPGMFAGASIHEELRLLVEAGLTRSEALVAATRSAGEFATRVFKATPFGEIAVGHRADLLLLPANPLDDLGAARHPLGVMVRGTWMTAADLDRVGPH